VGWLVLCYLASAIGAAAAVQASDFYGELIQPAWAPPAWLFGPVWTLLYTFMAIAAWLVWRVGGLQKNRPAFTVFLVQLALNALWSWLFFAWYLGALAFVDIVLLLVFIAINIVLFGRVSVWAGLLLVPYFLWVSFASVLNFAMWQLNPLILG
jgi:tryptophan-rich sensory protein